MALFRVKEQVASGLALAYQQGGIAIGLGVEAAQVYIAQYVYIMYKDGLRRVKEGPGLLDAPARIEQLLALIADAYVYAEVLLSNQVLLYL